jgi:hypothetical protein
MPGSAQQVGLGQALGVPNSLDVGAAREGLAGAGDDDGLDGRVGIAALASPSAMPTRVA